MSELTDVLSKLEAKAKTLESKPLLDFRDYINKERSRIGTIKEHPKVRELESAGVYCIYEGDKIVYIGSAGASHTLRYRIGDLFAYHPEYVGQDNVYGHSLTKKLTLEGKYKRFNTIDEVRDYYCNCRFKFIRAENDAEAHALEGILIMLFKPPFNNETKSVGN